MLNGHRQVGQRWRRSIDADRNERYWHGFELDANQAQTGGADDRGFLA